VNSVEAGGSASGIAWLPLFGLLALGVAAYWHRRRIR
jgi:LPXTG-motif cell wall-anchored protein